MARTVVLPPESSPRPDGTLLGGWWHDAEDGRIVCDLCPRECHLKPGDRGFCFVRQNLDGEMRLTTYGRSTGFCIDPIEKKPLNHFLPGTSVLSFGTAGCNLGCKFCQNWDISKSREVERLSEIASPESIAAAARHYKCRSVAYTYNDPVVWAEYAIDTAKACRAAGIKNVAVTAGYISPAARGPFYEYMDAANVDLKAFSEQFYYQVTYSHLQPVLDTLAWLKRETDVWFEITNLVIPRENDQPDEIRRMCDWIVAQVGPEVPVHFTAFHPDFRMLDRPATPHETLIQARTIAREQGLQYVYTGNVNDVANQSTYCPQCQGLLIERNWYDLGQYHLRGSRCGHCGHAIAGVFEDRPGNWGRRRQPVQMSPFQRPPAATDPRPEVKPPASSQASPMTSIPSSQSPAVSPNPPARPQLTEAQSGVIFRAACEMIAAAIQQRREQLPDATLGGADHLTVMGAFVTLKRQGKLRACCGALGRPMKLGEALRQSALRTALEDARLPPISVTELPYLEVDVQFLHAFQPVTARGAARLANVTVGRHGLHISRDGRSGLLLPAVAVEQGYNAAEFLCQVCRKAGLPTTAWEDDATVLQTFEAVEIPGRFAEETIVRNVVGATPLTAEELRILAEYCAQNLAALAQGATPSYYQSGVSDGTIHGGALTLHPAQGNAIHFFKLSLRPGVPLQSTLYSLTEAASNALRSGQLRLPSGDVRLAVSLLNDPAMHGTVAEPDLRGVEPARRALLVIEGHKSALVYDPNKTAEGLLQLAIQQAGVFQSSLAGLYSLAIQSTDPAVTIANAPRATPSSAVRAPAVAGKFYPSDPAELGKLVSQCLGPTQPTRPVPAVMLPHAGLIYSGRIAAHTLQRIQIPETVIILGPKHTRLGVDWAIAPHPAWTIPGAQLASDLDLVRELVAAIPGLQLDAAAHSQEHAIEVELPFLARLAPATKVVGIVVGAGDLERCRQFATGLAKVLKSRTNPPLLVISSDMNHYATDAENRQLDEIAMQALERLDPAAVFETVTGRNISMCGVLPAVMVLETLRQLGRLHRAERIAYATSADTSGDTSRVVGYCGMLWE